jgi:tropomodulin
LAIETPDVPDMVPFVQGTLRGKKYSAPEKPRTKQEEEIALDMGDEYETALGKASEEELVDLAGTYAIKVQVSILGQKAY